MGTSYKQRFCHQLFCLHLCTPFPSTFYSDNFTGFQLNSCSETAACLQMWHVQHKWKSSPSIHAAPYSSEIRVNNILISCPKPWEIPVSIPVPLNCFIFVNICIHIHTRWCQMTLNQNKWHQASDPHDPNGWVFLWIYHFYPYIIREVEASQERRQVLLFANT